jgi:putative transposase
MSMEPGQFYHIFNHANGAETIFKEEENYHFFLRQYHKYLGSLVDTYAYCLMPNHFHLLIRVKEDLDLSGFQYLSGFQNLTGLIKHPSNNPVIKAFSDFFNSYTKSFNKRYNRKGNLFIKSFHRKPILDHQQWQENFLYIHLNPVKHGFVKTIEEWKWTSWKGYQFPKSPSKLNREYYLNFFDGLEHLKELVELRREQILSKDFE